MTRRSHFAKQKKREKLVQLKWEKRQKLKAIVKSLHSSSDERAAAMAELNKLPKNSSPIRLRNRCQFTGRPRGFLRKFKLSRITFREMAHQGLIPGLFKASW